MKPFWTSLLVLGAITVGLVFAWDASHQASYDSASAGLHLCERFEAKGDIISAHDACLDATREQGRSAIAAEAKLKSMEVAYQAAEKKRQEAELCPTLCDHIISFHDWHNDAERRHLAHAVCADNCAEERAHPHKVQSIVDGDFDSRTQCAMAADSYEGVKRCFEPVIWW